MKKPHAYLVGGPPRVGKTKLMEMFMKERPMMSVSTDAVRYLLRRTEGVTDSRLWASHEVDVEDEQQRIISHRDNPQKVVELQNIESEAVWQGCELLIKNPFEDGYDIFLEGIAVLPEKLTQLDLNHSAVFLGNQSDSFDDIVLQTARSNKYDWMHSYSDELIGSYMVFFKKMSQYFEQEAKKHGYTYIDVSEGYYEENISKALKVLL